MADHTFNQKRLWILLFVLVFLLAQLMPFSPYAVSAQAGTCGQASLRAATFAVGSAPAADQDVEIPQEKVDLAVYAANWRHKLKDAAFVEGLVFDLFLLNTDRVPNADLTSAFESFEQIYKPVLDSLSDIQDTDQHDWIIHSMLNVALDIPEMAPMVPYVWKELTSYATSEFSRDSDYRIGRSAQRYNLTDHLLDQSSDIMSRVYACAKEIPEVAQAHDHHYSHNLVSSIIDGFDKIIADNPDLPIPVALLDGIGEDGTLTVSLDDLKALSVDEFEKIHATIDDIQETLVEIDKQQDVILDYLKDQELKAKWQEVMKKKAAEQEFRLNAIKSSISFITLLANQIDPKFAKRFSVVANSSLQVGVSLNNWLTAVSGLKGVDKITSLSTLALTGNVLGAVINVVSLFGDEQPTPEQMILEEIGRLRQQVDQLRQEMHSRFDRIDQELNAIYSSMHDRFNQVDIQLGKINGNILELQHGLLAIDLKLSRIEHNNFEFLDALGRRPLLEAINGGLAYAERTGSPMPYQPDFVGFENVLHSWATVHAFDPLIAGPIQRDYSDAQVLAELTTYPLDSNINYLNGWLSVHALPTIADQRLASPRDWLFAGRAYTQLGQEWPEHMRRINPQRQAGLSQIGVDLEAAMQNISTVQTPDGPQGNSLLYTTVISNYQNKMDALDSSIEALETAFMAEVQNNLRPGQPFDLYAGVAQTVTFATEGFQKMDYGNPVNTLPSPSNLIIPNYNQYNLAEYFRIFGAERSSVSVGGEFVAAPNNEVNAQLMPPGNCPPDCSLTANLQVSVTAYYSGVAVLTMQLMAGSVTVQLGTDATEYVVANWGDLKPRFEAEASVTPPSPELAQQRTALLDEITTKLEERLANYQQELYARIFSELTVGSLRTRAVEAGGGKALLDSFVILGLPRALAKDEFFHAMLLGNQQLVDDSEVLQSYAISATQLITEVNVLVNPRLALKQTTEERRAAFAEMVHQYLDAITAQTHVEGPDYIASTRAVFNLTMRIIRIVAGAEEPTPTPNPVLTPTPDPNSTPTPNPEEGATVTGLLFDDENSNGQRDAGEAGIAGATVHLNEDDSSISAALSRSTMTDADGVYTFTAVPPGQYTLQVLLPGGQSSVNIPPRPVTVSGNGTVVAPPTPIQVRNLIYLPALQKG